MRFGELIKRAQPELVVSPRHEKWLQENANPVYSEQAHEFAAQALRTVDRVRKGTISASSLESCGRRQMFTFLGMPQLRPTAKLAQIFQNGTFMHIRWQMAGLTEGWLIEAEVPVEQENPLRLSGTMDGVAYDGTVVELKSINTYGFSSVQSFGPQKAHLFQVGSYMVATGWEQATILYEDKNTQEYSEHVVELDEQLRLDVVARNEWVWDHVDREVLPEPLDKCLAGEGVYYRSCPYRDRCLSIRDWKEAEDADQAL